MGRRAVVPDQVRAVMSGSARHCWTLEELHGELQVAGHGADPSSVFRALGRLEAQGVVRSVPLEGRRGYYELAGEHHEHLVCEDCGEVEAVPCGLVRSWVEEVRRSCGFEVSDHHLVLRGRCQTCQEAELTAGAASTELTAGAASTEVTAGAASTELTAGAASTDRAGS